MTENKYIETKRLVDYFESRIQEKKDDIVRIEAQISELYNARDAAEEFARNITQPIPAPESDLEGRLKDILQDTKRQCPMIDAIKLHRAETGTGLKQSKEYIDKLRQKMGLV